MLQVFGIFYLEQQSEALPTLWEFRFGQLEQIQCYICLSCNNGHVYMAVLHFTTVFCFRLRCIRLG